MKDDLPVWAEIDLGRITRNVERIKKLLAPSTAFLAVVKANGYGHGAIETAKAAIEGGADWLGVARVSEAADIRTADIDVPILLLAEPPFEAVARAVDLSVVPTIYTEQIARAFSECADRLGRKVSAHVKVDTGMHRYGVQPEDALTFIDDLGRMKGLQIQGFWSHFAVAEDLANPFTKQQLEEFHDVLHVVGSRGEGLIRHIANSAGALTIPESHFDLVRIGIALYGIPPSPSLADRVELEPAMSLKSRVGMIKRLEPGKSISYGQRYTTRSETSIATIPCGYADGINRALSNRGEVLIKGRRYMISGTITMDHLLVDLGNDDVETGDEVVLLGHQGSGEISAQAIADLLETIPYEIVCGVSSRVRRIYMEGN